MFNPKEFLCPQSCNLSMLLNKDFPGLHRMSAGLPEWLQRFGFVQLDQIRMSYEGYIKQLGCSDLRACYLRHLDTSHETRVRKVGELAGKPFDCSEIEQWARVAERITYQVEARELTWFSDNPPQWTPTKWPELTYVGL